MTPSISDDFSSAWRWAKEHGSSYWGALGSDLAALVDRADTLFVPHMNQEATRELHTDRETRIWEAAKDALFFFVTALTWYIMPDIFVAGFITGMVLSPPIRAVADRIQMLFLKANLPWKGLFVLISIGSLKFIPLLPFLLGSYAAWRINPMNDSECHFFTTRPGHESQHLFIAFFQNLYDSSTTPVAPLSSWWWNNLDLNNFVNPYRWRNDCPATRTSSSSGDSSDTEGMLPYLPTVEMTDKTPSSPHLFD